MTLTREDRTPAGGGRCQELALAAARVLHDAGSAADGITLLAAGTDGRDGATDAAGAVVDCDDVERDRRTPAAIRRERSPATSRTVRCARRTR